MIIIHSCHPFIYFSSRCTVGFYPVLYSYFETDHSRCSVNNNKQLLLIRYKNNGILFYHYIIKKKSNLFIYLDRFILRAYRKVCKKLFSFSSAIVSRNENKPPVRFRFNFSVHSSIPTWILVVKSEDFCPILTNTVSQFRKLYMRVEYTKMRD